MSQWLIVHTPQGPRVWPLDAVDPAERELLVLAGRDVAGVPAGNAWVMQPQLGFDLLVTDGQPHRDLMARAVVGAGSELVAHKDTARAVAYRQECVRLQQEQRIAAAEAVLAQLSDADVDALIARRLPAGGTVTGTGRRT